jgi:hypothetical protein
MVKFKVPKAVETPLEKGVTNIIKKMVLVETPKGGIKVTNRYAIGEEILKLLQRKDIDTKEAVKKLGKEIGKKLFLIGASERYIKSCLQDLMAVPVVKSFNTLREGVLEQFHDDFKTMETAWKNGKYKHNYHPQEEVAKYAKEIVLFTEAERKGYLKKVNGVFLEADQLLKDGKTALEVLCFIDTKLAKIRDELVTTAWKRAYKESHNIVKKSKILQEASKIAMAEKYAMMFKGPDFKFGELPKELRKLSTKWKKPKLVINVEAGFHKPFTHIPGQQHPCKIFSPSELKKAQEVMRKEGFKIKLKKMGKVGAAVALILGIGVGGGYAIYGALKEK